MGKNKFEQNNQKISQENLKQDLQNNFEEKEIHEETKNQLDVFATDSFDSIFEERKAKQEKELTSTLDKTYSNPTAQSINQMQQKFLEKAKENPNSAHGFAFQFLEALKSYFEGMGSFMSQMDPTNSIGNNPETGANSATANLETGGDTESGPEYTRQEIVIQKAGPNNVFSDVDKSTLLNDKFGTKEKYKYSGDQRIPRHFFKSPLGPHYTSACLTKTEVKTESGDEIKKYHEEWLETQFAYLSTPPPNGPGIKVIYSFADAKGFDLKDKRHIAQKYGIDWKFFTVETSATNCHENDKIVLSMASDIHAGRGTLDHCQHGVHRAACMLAQAFVEAGVVSDMREAMAMAGMDLNKFKNHPELVLQLTQRCYEKGVGIPHGIMEWLEERYPAAFSKGYLPQPLIKAYRTNTNPTYSNLINQ